MPGNREDHVEVRLEVLLPRRAPLRAATAAEFEVANIIDFVEIATTGNAVDFGDMLNTFADCAGTSDSNGGLAE